MAAVKPLVIVAGQMEQIQTGDTLDASLTTMSPGIVSLTNSNAGSITIGQVVYIDGAGTCDLAKADAAATAIAVGLVSDTTVATTDAAAIQVNGVLAGLSGLTAGSQYYLSEATAGLFTTTAPTTVTEFVVPIGVALSTTQMKIGIEQPVLL